MTALFSVLGRLLVTLGMVAAALIVGLGLWDYYMDAPWTRDGRVRADVVAVAPDVSGLVTEVLVEDNQVVRKGDVLFRIDPDRFRIGLRQAEAMVEGRKATAEQTAADYARYSKLSDAAVSQQKVEATKAADLSAQAAYEQALADRDLAKLNLERSAVRASVNGRITNMELRPGAYVTTGRGVMALIDRDTVRIEGYFEETKLPRIRVGAPVNVQLMGEDGVLTGRVASIAGHRRDRPQRRHQPAGERQPDLLVGAAGPAHPRADHPRRRPGGPAAGQRPDRDGVDRAVGGRGGPALALDGVAGGARPLKATEHSRRRRVALTRPTIVRSPHEDDPRPRHVPRARHVRRGAGSGQTGGANQGNVNKSGAVGGTGTGAGSMESTGSTGAGMAPGTSGGPRVSTPGAPAGSSSGNGATGSGAAPSGK